MTKHKCALIFLSVMNLINLAAGIITQITLIKNSDVVSIIPITVEMTVDQILLLNFLAVSLIITVISVVTTYLVADASYSFWEILTSCAGIFLVIPVIILLVSVFNAVNAAETVDKVSIIVSSLVYLLFNAVNFGCLITVKEDEEL